MGLFTPTMKWIYLTKLRYGIDFSRTVTLGRQYCEPSEWRKAAKQLKGTGGGYGPVVQPDGYTENFWEWLGSEKTDFLDYSPYEGANIVWDLNKPIPDQYQTKYSVVVDGGTMEHVFNYPQAIKNAMEMVEIGGHLIIITPGNGWCGHGFYQFSPCLFWDLLNEANGYRVLEISLLDMDKTRTSKMIQKVTNRNYLESKGRGLLLVVAQRIGSIPEHIEAQQGSYSLIWEGEEAYFGSNQEKMQTKTVKDSIKTYAKKSKLILNMYKRLKKLTGHKEYYDLDKEMKRLSGVNK